MNREFSFLKRVKKEPKAIFAKVVLLKWCWAKRVPAAAMLKGQSVQGNKGQPVFPFLWHIYSISIYRPVHFLALQDKGKKQSLSNNWKDGNRPLTNFLPHCQPNMFHSALFPDSAESLPTTQKPQSNGQAGRRICLYISEERHNNNGRKSLCFKKSSPLFCFFFNNYQFLEVCQLLQSQI